MQDSVSRGRNLFKNNPDLYTFRNPKLHKNIKHHYGEKHPRAKLTEEQVLQIRKEYKPRSGVILAKKYSVARTLITMIVGRKIWKHI